MKSMRKPTSVLALLLLLVLLVGTLAGCTVQDPTWNSDTSGDSRTVTDVSVVEGSIIVTYSDGGRINLGSAVTNVTENTIDVTVTDTDSTAIAASRALLSTVSVVCGFEKTVQYQSMFGKPYTRTEEYQSAGAGVIYALDKTAGDAYIITNQHVVYDVESNASNHVSKDISIYLYGTTDAIPAAYVGGSVNYDIAVLKVTGNPYLRTSAAEAVTISDSEQAQVGTTALVVGNPEGGGISTTLGIVSVDSEYIVMDSLNGNGTTTFRVIRIDAAVNSGNSGGGLYNGAGELIGIVNAKVSSTSVENIGYAIPSNVAVAIAQNIIDYHASEAAQCVRRAMLGISLTTTDSAMVYDEETAMTVIRETVKVNKIEEEGGLGAQMGLAAGDTLVSVKVGTRETVVLTRQYQVIDELLNARVGDTVALVIRRSGSSEDTTVTVEITADCLQDY